MTSKPTSEQLANMLTQSAVAARLGVQKTTVNNWTVRHTTFPKPIARGLYWWPDVKRWHAGNRK